MKPACVLLAAVAILVVLPPHAVIAKNASIGIYAVVDQVTFEPNERSPEFIRILGVFVVPVRPISSGGYDQPKKGYLYFRIRPEREEAIRKDWAQLKHFAGTGEVVAFGEYWVPNPNDPQGNPHHSLEVNIHALGEPSSPDDYPLYLGQGSVLKASDIVSDADREPMRNKIMAQFREAPHR